MLSFHCRWMLLPSTAGKWGEAASTLRSRAAHWLSSEAGQEWIKERALLFGEGGLSPDVESISSDGDAQAEAVREGKKPWLL